MQMSSKPTFQLTITDNIAYPRSASGVSDPIDSNTESTQYPNHGVPLLSCTTCPKLSTSAYEWQRHEAKHHLPWICMPAGTHIVGDHCGIYRSRDISDRHGATHYKLDECANKPLRKRSFRGYDKLADHLRTHLGTSHWTELPDTLKKERREVLELWRDLAEMDRAAHWCGFCAEFCPCGTYDNRMSCSICNAGSPDHRGSAIL